MSDEAKTKRVHFLGLVVSEPGGLTKHRPVDWAEKINEFHARPQEEKLFKGRNGQVLTLEVVNTQRQAVLGRVVDETGLRLGHKVTGTFKPVQSESADEFFTKVTYVQFIEGCNAVALIGGAGERPAVSAVESLVNELCPLEPGSSWATKLLTGPGRVKEVQKASGVSMAEVTMNGAAPNLFELPSADAVSFGDLPDAIAAMFGAEITLSLKVQIRGGQASTAAHRQLRDQLLAAFEHWSGRKKKKLNARTTGLTGDLVELIEYHLAAYVDLPLGAVSAEALQEAVLHGLNDVSARWQSRVQAALTEG